MRNTHRFFKIPVQSSKKEEKRVCNVCAYAFEYFKAFTEILIINRGITNYYFFFKLTCGIISELNFLTLGDENGTDFDAR